MKKKGSTICTCLLVWNSIFLGLVLLFIIVLFDTKVETGSVNDFFDLGWDPLNGFDSFSPAMILLYNFLKTGGAITGLGEILYIFNNENLRKNIDWKGGVVIFIVICLFMGALLWISRPYIWTHIINSAFLYIEATAFLLYSTRNI